MGEFQINETTDVHPSGVEYFTDINPTNKINSKKVQNEYMLEYNLAIHTFLSSIFVDEQTIMNYMKKNNTDYYVIIIDCNKENEIITNNSYDFKFLKSVFLIDKKKIITDFLNDNYSAKFNISKQIKIGTNVYKYILTLLKG